MPSFSSGLIVTPSLRAAQVMSVDMTFEPSIGIMARKVDKLGTSIRSFREPLTEAIRAVVIPSIRTNFLKSGRPRWVDDTEATWKQKRGKILVESGALMQTMGYMNIWHIDSEKAMLANLPSSVWYGAIHQGGIGAHQAFHDPVTNSAVNLGDTGAIPARPFVMLQAEDLPLIDEIFVKWVGRKVRMAGL